MPLFYTLGKAKEKTDFEYKALPHEKSQKEGVE